LLPKIDGFVDLQGEWWLMQDWRRQCNKNKSLGRWIAVFPCSLGRLVCPPFSTMISNHVFTALLPSFSYEKQEKDASHYLQPNVHEKPQNHRSSMYHLSNTL